MKKLISLIICLLMIFPFVLGASASGLHTDNGIMKNIPPDTTVSELKTLLPKVIGVSINETAIGNNEKIGTGYNIVCGSGTLKASVLGDLDGDAFIDSVDYLLLKKYYLGNLNLNDNQKAAADIDEDGKIDAYDYLCIKRYILGTYSFGQKTNASSVPVLLYHHIVPDEAKASNDWKDNDITISISDFTRQMQIIKDSGYTVVTTDELVEYVKGIRTIPAKSVVLCFDDGYLSNTYYAAPILRKFGFKATVFDIMYSYVYGKYQPVNDPYVLMRFSKYDFEPNTDVLSLQCHTFSNHEHMSQQSYDFIYTDLMKCQKNVPTKFFAYPYGDFNDTVKKAVKDAGFEAAFSTVEKNATVSIDLYEIPRHTITVPMTDEAYRNLLMTGVR